MKADEYIEELTKQIRCRKAVSSVEKEIRQHIEDQKSDYVLQGMSEIEAEEASVREMGDPVETGVALDRIHRPKMAWGMIALIAVISVIGFIVQFLLGTNPLAGGIESSFIGKQAVYVITGFVLMIAICCLDYSRIGLWGREITACFVLLLISARFFGVQLNGAVNWVSAFGITINIKNLLYLFAPLYGAVIFYYRGKGYTAVVKCILWMLPPLCIAISIPSMGAAVNLFLIFSITLTIAILNNNFLISKNKALIVLWGSFVLAGAALFAFIMNSGVSYRILRVRYMLNPDASGDGYMVAQVRNIISRCQLIGENTNGYSIYETLPNVQYDFVFTHIIAEYGFVMAAVILGLLVILCIGLMKSVIGQRNQLGMLMGTACGLTFIVQILLYLVSNMGVTWSFGTFCPFFSYGGTGTFITYILLGVLLSVYRYQNVLPAEKGNDLRKGKKVRLVIVDE